MTTKSFCKHNSGWIFIPRWAAEESDFPIWACAWECAAGCGAMNRPDLRLTLYDISSRYPHCMMVGQEPAV